MQFASVLAQHNLAGHEPEAMVVNAQEHELRVLNELIVAVLDTADERLLNDALDRHPDAQCYDAGEFFARRLEIVDSLHTHVRALDGKPVTEGSILAATYAAMRHSVKNPRPSWLQKGDVANDDDHLLERRFIAALSDPHISSPVKATIKAMHRKVHE